MVQINNPADVPEFMNNVPANGKTILIVEDDPFISRMYATKLKLSGFNVVTKGDGREAYAAIKAAPPDLIMLDENMPEISGIQLLKMLHEEGFDFSAHPVIMLTNSGREEDRKTVKDMGFDYYTKDELTPVEILHIINTKLGTGTN